MANEEHKELSQYIKYVHLTLRKSTNKLGAQTAWQEHCKNNVVLAKYAQCMEKLATTHWESNCNNENSEATSRIKWVVDYCDYYFNENGYTKYNEKEHTVAELMGTKIETKENFSQPLKLLDVGSCYNPFKMYNMFDVVAIDLHPANKSVFKCDFLNIDIGETNIITKSTVSKLQANAFDIVTFCFLLEYIPNSELRIKACENAYRLLTPGGLLIITTPDSKHVGANSKIMKCWRYTLAKLGFNRIKYEKTRFMHCMAFRKSICKEVAVRWTTLYKEPYMEYAIHIPQDFNSIEEDNSVSIDKETVAEDFLELPLHHSN